MPSQSLPLKKRRHAIVPRSLFAYAGIGLGIGAVPLTIACSNSASVGIEPAMGGDDGDIADGSTDNDGSPDESIGIRPAMDFEAGTDVGTIGIRPAMDFEAGADATDTDDASDSSTTSTSGDGAAATGEDSGAGP